MTDVIYDGHRQMTGERGATDSITINDEIINSGALFLTNLEDEKECPNVHYTARVCKITTVTEDPPLVSVEWDIGFLNRYYSRIIHINESEKVIDAPCSISTDPTIINSALNCIHKCLAPFRVFAVDEGGDTVIVMC